MKAFYREYIESDEWKLRRDAFIKQRGKYCLICHETKHLRVHHGSYAHVGNERDDELFVLCDRHHKELHRVFALRKKKGDRWFGLLSFTRRFIRRRGRKKGRSKKELRDIYPKNPVKRKKLLPGYRYENDIDRSEEAIARVSRKKPQTKTVFISSMSGKSILGL